MQSAAGVAGTLPRSLTPTARRSTRLIASDAVPCRLAPADASPPRHLAARLHVRRRCLRVGRLAGSVTCSDRPRSASRARPGSCSRRKPLELDAVAEGGAARAEAARRAVQLRGRLTRRASTAPVSSPGCTAASGSASRTTRRRSTASADPFRARASAGRPRLLQRSRPRRPLRRTRPDDPLAAVGRDGRDPGARRALEPARRRPPRRLSEAPHSTLGSRPCGS